MSLPEFIFRFDQYVDDLTGTTVGKLVIKDDMAQFLKSIDHKLYEAIYNKYRFGEYTDETYEQLRTLL